MLEAIQSASQIAIDGRFIAKQLVKGVAVRDRVLVDELAY